MQLISKVTFDKYTRHARIAPALIVVLPWALATFAWFPAELPGQGLLWSLLVGGGGTALLAQVSRDRGRRKQTELFEQWGGKPTTRLLRHRDAPNSVKLERYHNKLDSVISDVSLPSAEEERTAPEKADDVYDACVAYLMKRTRDRSKELGRLVFEENCNYGFRRNLWGMRPLGITASCTGMLAVGAHAYLSHLEGTPLQLTTLIPLVVNTALFVGWIVWFTPDWVRDAADAYAERLLATCESL